MEDSKGYYILVYYENSKIIYYYDFAKEKLLEFLGTSDFTVSFIADNFRKRIYKYYKRMGTFIVEDVTEEEIEVFREKLEEREFLDIKAVDGYFFIKFKDNRNFTLGFLFSIEENLLVEINDREFLETVGKMIFFEEEEIIYLAMEESYYKEEEIVEFRKGFIESDIGRNLIVLYELNNLVEEIIMEKPIKKNLLIDSTGNDYVSLVDVYNSKVLVFNKSQKNKVIFFAVDDSIAFKTVDKKINSIVAEEKLFFINENKNFLNLVNTENKLLLSIPKTNNVEVKIKGVLKDRLVVFKSNDFNGDKSVNIFDLESRENKVYHCDFLTIDKKLY